MFKYTLVTAVLLKMIFPQRVSMNPYSVVHDTKAPFTDAYLSLKLSWNYQAHELLKQLDTLRQKYCHPCFNIWSLMRSQDVFEFANEFLGILQTIKKFRILGLKWTII